MKKFIEQFTKQKLFDEALVRRIGNDFFLLQPELSQVMKKIKLPPLHAGLYLGREEEKTAKPSLDLLQMLAKSDAKKVWLNKKGAWMFICRRPALEKSVVRTEAKSREMVIVMNESDECIGYGVFEGKGVKNYYDIGDFLRRERRARRT
jgi:ribosome biogenesis protein Nip4